MTTMHAWAALIIVVLPGIVSAQIEREMIAKCAVEDGVLTRLECFDQLARALDLDGPQVVPTSVTGGGKWNVTVQTNPIDDSTTVVLSLIADSGVRTLLVRCQSDKTELYIDWDDYLGSEASVLTRVGSQDAQTQRWELSSNSRATFHPGSPISFIKSLMDVDRLVVQVTPYNESPVTAIFDVRGLSNAATPLREVCDWEWETEQERLTTEAEAETERELVELEQGLRQRLQDAFKR